MKSHITDRFRKSFKKIPVEIKRKAKEAYRAWQEDPYNRSLKLKKIHGNLPVYSIRIGIRWRAVGIRRQEHIVWFWIGSHEEYNQIIKDIPIMIRFLEFLGSNLREIDIFRLNKTVRIATLF